MNVVALGIGYGNRHEIHGYCFPPPAPLPEIRSQLESAGFNIRDVVGFIPILADEPHIVAMMHNPPDDVQPDTTVGKGALGNITPPGGKVDGSYKRMAQAGLITFEQAYAARGFIGEADEIGLPSPPALALLNRAQGLPSNETLTSPDGKDLHVLGKPVRVFRYRQKEQPTQLSFIDEDITHYDPLTNVRVTYSIGLNRLDRKGLVYNATAVANLWLPATSRELDDISHFVEQTNVDRISRMELVDIRQFGQARPTTVANMVATGLYASATPENFKALTGLDKPAHFPTPADLPVYSKAVQHQTLEEVISAFKQQTNKP